MTVEFEKLDAIRNVCRDYAFTDKQIKDLDKLDDLLKNDPGALDAAIPSLATSLREMSIMAWSAMSPLDKAEDGSYAQSLEGLLVGKSEGILPLEVLLSPCFMSPQALRSQARNMENYANGKLQNDVNLTGKLAALEEKFQAAGYGSKESEKKIENMGTRAGALKASYTEKAQLCREIAENSAGMYRFQGML
ncbi:MAG: hypothetical protein ACKOLA_01445, partial [Spartobacteria bacterium]